MTAHKCTLRPILTLCLLLSTIHLMNCEQARGAEKTFTVILKKLKVEKTNKKGNYWDLSKGKPDIQIRISNLDDKDSKPFKTKTFDNVYEINQAIPTTIRVREGKKLVIKIVDKDFDLDDLIGVTDPTISKAGILKLEKFDRVILLELDVRDLNN